MMQTAKLSPCRVCASIEMTPCFTVNGCSLSRCSACRYVQIDTQPSQEELHAIYSASYFASSKYRDQNILRFENDKRLALLKRFLKGQSEVLDSGCASGDFLKHAKSEYSMHGCDISAYAVNLARQNNPDIADQIFVADLDRDDLPAEHYDAICLWDVLEHLWDPGHVCAVLSRLLKPGGYLFASTPDIGSLSAKVFGKRWAFMTPPEHMGFFNAMSIRRLLTSTLPFTIVYRKNTGKWTNFGFLVYKLGRVAPALASERLTRFVNSVRFGHVPIYVPTHDIQYIVARKEL
jgi:2-polyprenyl-3-methyl-5-hydroxy-6-metoxy-1,4-benzoquinol methylase